MKFLFALVLALTCALALTPAKAQTVPGTATLSWTNVAGYTSVEVHWATSPIADEAACANPCTNARAAQATLPGSPTTSNHVIQVTQGATLYFRLKGVNANGRSAFSNQASKVIDVPQLPGPPSSLILQLIIQPVAPAASAP